MFNPIRFITCMNEGNEVSMLEQSSTVIASVDLKEAIKNSLQFCDHDMN